MLGLSPGIKISNFVKKWTCYLCPSIRITIYTKDNGVAKCFMFDYKMFWSCALNAVSQSYFSAVSTMSLSRTSARLCLQVELVSDKCVTHVHVA